MVLLLSVSLLFGCGAPAEKEPVDEGGADEPGEVVEEVDVIKIGAILPLTGGDALDGQNQKNAHDLAIEEINAAGGIKSLGGAKLEIVYGDTQGKPEIGNAETERLITNEGVVAVMGAYHGGVTVSALRIAERYEVPFLCPNALVNEIVEMGMKYTFKTVPNSSDFSRDSGKLILALNEKFGTDAKTVATLVADNLIGQQMLEGWDHWLPELGLERVESQVFPPTATNLQSEILKIKAANPDVILSQANAKEAILIVKTMQELDYWPKYGLVGAGGGFSNPDVWESLGDAAENLFLVNDWYPFSARPGSQEANQAFKDKYGSDMTGNANTTYAGTWVIKEAIELAASTDPKDIAEALRTGEFDHPKITFMYDKVKFAENGLNEFAINVAAQVKDGKPIVVWPDHAALEEPLWPVPHWSER